MQKYVHKPYGEFKSVTDGDTLYKAFGSGQHI